MKQRAITAVFFVLAMLAGIYGGKLCFFLLCLTIVVGATWELLGLLLPKDEQTLYQRGVGVLVGAIPFAYFGYAALVKNLDSDSALPFKLLQDGLMKLVMAQNLLLLFGFVSIAFFVLLLSELLLRSHNAFNNLGHYLLGFFYICVPFIALVTIATNGGAYYPNRVLGLLLLTWTNDTMAYVIGSKIGKTKLLERISPNKTWEGTLGGTFCTVAMAWLLATYLPQSFGLTEWLALGVIVGCLGTPGDLVESMLKRTAGVKDSGNLLPGHGGLLDRFDAFIVILPFVWLALYWLRA